MMTGMNFTPHFICKDFSSLTPQELYAILGLRIAVFMVEQSCFYTEVDGYDPQALHLFAWHETKPEIALCARFFPPNHDYHGERCVAARIGRIAVHEDYRGQGLGHIVMQKALIEIATRYGVASVTLSAQAHLQKFYQAHGFEADGEPYDEDGIAHVRMVRA
jgi:ElaA protein